MDKVPHHPGSPYEAFADHGLLVFPPPSGNEFERFPGVAVQLPDGKIFVALIRVPGIQLELWRFTADGVPDQGFGNGGALQIPDSGFSSVADVAIQSDGKLLIYGSALEQSTARLMRVTAEGAPDTGFGDGGFAAAPIPIGMGGIGGIAVLPNGQVIGSGGHSAGRPDGTSWLLRFTASGEIDESFGQRGIVLVAPARLGGHLLVVEGGHIFASGAIGDTALVAKYRFDGSLEPAFGNGGYVTFVPGDGRLAETYGIALQPDGKLVAVGQMGFTGMEATDAVVLRLGSDGAFDGAFNDGQPLEINLRVDCNSARDVAIQADGRIVVCGRNAMTVNGVLFRLEENGAIDGSFGLPNGDGSPGFRGYAYTLLSGTYHQVSSLVLTLDGHVMVFGITRLSEVPFERPYISKYSL